VGRGSKERPRLGLDGVVVSDQQAGMSLCMRGRIRQILSWLLITRRRNSRSLEH